MKRLSIISGVLFLCTSLMAANKITGKIIDESNNQHIEYANVSLLTQDSTFITGVATDNGGGFLLKEVNDGDYILCISCVGYENSYLSIRNLQANLNLGELPLSPDNVMLEGVTVTASPIIKKTDRQIILPTEMQTKAASNGVSLLRNLQLSRILINPIDNSITIPGGDNVQLRINGVEVAQAEIIAIRPTDVIRIEYIDNPGARYGNAGAVLNYIVKRRESGGSISADLTNGVSDTGYGEHNLAAKYHFNKSELSTTVYWGQRDLKWTRENNESFHFPEAYQENREVGEPTKVKYDNLNFNLNYSYQDNDKQLLNIALRNQYSDTPSSMSDRISILYEGDTSYSISDLSTSKVVIPSLDIYYQRNLKNKQTIYADIVASYLDSKNERTFIGKGPGLVLVVPQVFHLHAHLLHHLPVDGVLQRLADLHETGDKGIAPEGAVGVAGQQQLVPVGDGYDDGGADLGVLDLAAGRADHGPLDVADLHLMAAMAAELPRAVPPVELHGGDGGEGRLHGPHRPDAANVHIFRALRHGVRRPGQIAVHPVQREHMKGVLRGDGRPEPGQGPAVAVSLQQHPPLADTQGDVVGVGLSDDIGAVKPVGRDILYHKTIPLSLHFL